MKLVKLSVTEAGDTILWQAARRRSGVRKPSNTLKPREDEPHWKTVRREQILPELKALWGRMGFIVDSSVMRDRLENTTAAFKREFETTLTDEKAIATAAIAGFKSQPVKGYKIPEYCCDLHPDGIGDEAFAQNTITVRGVTYPLQKTEPVLCGECGEKMVWDPRAAKGGRFMCPHHGFSYE